MSAIKMPHRSGISGTSSSLDAELHATTGTALLGIIRCTTEQSETLAQTMLHRDTLRLLLVDLHLADPFPGKPEAEGTTGLAPVLVSCCAFEICVCLVKDAGII